MKYFVEPKTDEANQRVGVLLEQIRIAEASRQEGQEDTHGNKHDVWEIPDLRTMKLIRSMEREDSRVIIEYWKREETGGARLESARFLVVTAPARRIRRTTAFKKAVAGIPF